LILLETNEEEIPKNNSIPMLNSIDEIAVTTDKQNL
jgi:hypothetical protein